MPHAATRRDEGPTQGTHTEGTPQGTHTGDPNRGSTQRGGPHRGPTTGGEGHTGDPHRTHTDKLVYYSAKPSQLLSQKPEPKTDPPPASLCFIVDFIAVVTLLLLLLLLLLLMLLVSSAPRTPFTETRAEYCPPPCLVVFYCRLHRGSYTATATAAAAAAAASSQLSPANSFDRNQSRILTPLLPRCVLL